MLARACLGIAALQAVEPHNFERFVFWIGGHGKRCRNPFALDLDDIAFGDAKRLKCRARHAGYALP